MADFKVISENLAYLRSQGAPQPDVDAYLKSQGVDEATLRASGFTATPSTAKSAALGTAQGLAFNMADEVASGIAATVGRPNGQAIPGKTWTERYENAKNIARAGMKSAQEAHPVAFTTGQIAGAVAPAILAPEAFGSNYIASAPTATSMAARSGGVGAIMGGVNAFGAAEGTPVEQAKQTAVGAAIGGAVGAVLPKTIDLTTKLGSWIYNGAKGLFVPSEPVTEAATAGANAVGDAAEAIRPRASVDVTLNNKSLAINKIAEALKRDGYSVDDIQRMLDAMGPDATLADLGKNTQQLLTSTMGAPGPAKQIGSTLLENRQVGEQPRLVESVTKALGGGKGFHETDAELLSRLEKEASPLYQKAFGEAQPVDISGVLDQIDNSLAKTPQKSPIRAAVEKVKGMLMEEVKSAGGKSTNTPYSDLETLHNAKLAIDDMLSKYSGDESLGNVSRGKVMQIKNALLDAMDATNPTYQEARNLFSGTMTSKDALEAGRAFIKNDAETTAAALADMAPADQQFFREGAKRALVDVIKSKPSDVSVVQLLRKTGLLEKVQAIAPSKEAFNQFVQDLSNARRFAGTRATALGGSQSVEKFLGAADLASGAASAAQQASSPAGAFMWLLGKLDKLRQPSEQTRAEIAQALLQSDRGSIDKTLEGVSKQQLIDLLKNYTATGITAGGTSAGASALGRRP